MEQNRNEPPPDADPAQERPCLPPGHPVSWGLLTAGTVLDGCAYLRPEMAGASRRPPIEGVPA